MTKRCQVLYNYDMLNVEQRLQRNRDLIKNYLSGMSVVELVAKYEVNSQQIYIILKQNNINPNRYNRPTKNEGK